MDVPSTSVLAEIELVSSIVEEPVPKCSKYDINIIRYALLKHRYIMSVQYRYSYIQACIKIINTLDIDQIMNSFTLKELVYIFIVKHKDFSIRHAEYLYDQHCKFEKSNNSATYIIYPAEFLDELSKCPFITDTWLEEHLEFINILHPVIMLNSSNSMSYDFIVKHYITSKYKPYICDHIARNFKDISTIKKYNYLVLDMKLVSSNPVITIDVYLENKDQLAFDLLQIINMLNPRDVLKYHKELGVCPIIDPYWTRHTRSFSLEEISNNIMFPWDAQHIITMATDPKNVSWWFIRKHTLFAWNFRKLSLLEPPISLVRETMYMFSWDIHAISRRVSEKEFLENRNFDMWSYNVIAEKNEKISFETCMTFMDNILPTNQFWYNNTSKFTDITFILARINYKWNWTYIVKNQMISDWSFLYKHNPVDVPSDMLYMLSKCKNIPLKVIADNINYRWNWELITERTDLSFNIMYEIMDNISCIDYSYIIQAITNKRIHAASSIELIADDLPPELVECVTRYVYY